MDRASVSTIIGCKDPTASRLLRGWSTDPAEAFSSSVVDVFADTGFVELGDLSVAMPTITRSRHRLELRDNGALCAGTVAAVSKCGHRPSQPWSRCFDEHATDFTILEGLIYRKAHNDALVCSANAVARLDHAGFRPLLIQVMRQNHLTF